MVGERESPNKEHWFFGLLWLQISYRSEADRTFKIIVLIIFGKSYV